MANDDPFVGPNGDGSTGQKAADDPFIGNDDVSVTQHIKNDPGYIASYFAGLVKQGPGAITGALRQIPIFNIGGSVADIGHYFNKNIPSGEEINAREAQGLGQLSTGVVKGAAGFDANAVHPQGFGEKTAYNVGGITPMLLNPEGGVAGVAKNVVSGVGGAMGQTAAQYAFPHSGTAQTIGTIIGAMLGGKVANAPEAVVSATRKLTTKEAAAKYVSDQAASAGRSPEAIEAYGNAPENAGKDVMAAEAIGGPAIPGTRVLGQRPGETATTLGPDRKSVV